MNENTEESISIVVVLFIFLLACTLAVVAIKMQDSTIKAIQKSSLQEERRLFIDLQEVNQETYTGSAVLQSIYQIHNLNTDILVDNTLFQRNIDIDETDVSGINLQKVYQVSYVRDVEGILQKIIFK